MKRFLKDRMSSISSDLYEEILKPNKCHTNHIIKIGPCKTTIKDLIIQILMQKVVTILQFTHSDKTNHTNRIIEIVACETVLSKPFSLMTKKSIYKNLDILKTKRAFKMK